MTRHDVPSCMRAPLSVALAGEDGLRGRVRATKTRQRGIDATLKAAAYSIPARPSLELYGTIHTPRDYRPLLRPEGPFCGSGV